jgi:hypothetical protein
VDGFGAATTVASPAIAGVVTPGVVTMGDGTLDMKSTGDPARAAEATHQVEGGPEAPQAFKQDDLGGCSIV